MTDIIKDLSTLTTIPEKALNKLGQKIIYCVCEAIQEDLIQENDITELDLGIGILYIKQDGNQAKYKFVPSDNFNKSVVNTYAKKLNLLEDILNISLTKQFIEVYKDLC